MPDGGNDRDLGIINGPGHALVVERPEILHRAAAAAGNDEVRDLIAVGIADRARDLRRGLRALHAYRQELDLGQRIPLAENAEHIHDRSTGGGGDDGDGMRIFGDRLLVRRIKKALLGQLFLQLLERNVKIARAVGCERIAVELVRAVAREDRHTAGGNHLHPVFRPEAQALRARAEHDAAQRALRVLERKIMMAGRIDFIVAELAAHADIAEQLVAVEQKFDIFVDLRDGNDVLLHHSPSCRAVSTAMPMALSVEYCGSAKTGENSRIRSRSMELEATPPENTTGRPGFSANAARVASAMQVTMQFMTNLAVSAGLFVAA